MLFEFLPDIAASINDIPKDGIVSRTVFKNEQVKAVMFGFDTGQELSEHTSTHPAIIHILQGEADLTLGGEARSASAGAWVYMTPNLPHSVHAKTPVIMLLLMLDWPANA
jgi:quercetin dioxygenase-like cupin family protein